MISFVFIFGVCGTFWLCIVVVIRFVLLFVYICFFSVSLQLNICQLRINLFCFVR